MPCRPCPAAQHPPGVVVQDALTLFKKGSSSRRSVVRLSSGLGMDEQGVKFCFSSAALTMRCSTQSIRQHMAGP